MIYPDPFAVPKDTWDTIVKFWYLDLSETDTILAPFYPLSGKPASRFPSCIFDRHQIPFKPDTGDICISASIDTDQRAALNLSDSFNLTMSDRMKAYMKIHYKKFLEKEDM